MTMFFSLSVDSAGVRRPVEDGGRAVSAGGGVHGSAAELRPGLPVSLAAVRQRPRRGGAALAVSFIGLCWFCPSFGVSCF